MKMKLLDSFSGGRTCRGFINKTKFECRADGCAHMCVPSLDWCVCVCVWWLLHVLLGVREPEQKAQRRSCRSVTPDSVWTQHSDIFTFNSTFFKHPVVPFVNSYLKKKDFKGKSRKRNSSFS